MGADSERDPAGGWTHYLTADAKSAGGVLNFLHRDHLQSVRRVTDATGALTRTSVYAPYGKQVETILAPLSPAEPKGWIGERTDPETGPTYLHARYYDAVLGRFLSPDWWDASDPAVGTDRYGYSGSDPVNKSDVNGHQFVDWTNTKWEFSTSSSGRSSSAVKVALQAGGGGGGLGGAGRLSLGGGLGGGSIGGGIVRQYPPILLAPPAILSNGGKDDRTNLPVTVLPIDSEEGSADGERERRELFQRLRDAVGQPSGPMRGQST